jgi:hypothetical protein
MVIYSPGTIILLHFIYGKIGHRCWWCYLHFTDPGIFSSANRVLQLNAVHDQMFVFCDFFLKKIFLEKKNEILQNVKRGRVLLNMRIWRETLQD